MATTGVSNLIGAMLALVITIAIAAVAATVVMHYVTISTENIQVTVQSVGLIESADTTIFSITIQNSGSVALSALSVTINGNTITAFNYNGSPISSSNQLPAGLSASYESSTLTGTFTIGSTYSTVITAASVNSGTYAIGTSVFCTGA
ncbi:MAG: hypothetical protein ABSE82_07260 [Nitrososphaerales archaeon]|jgi:flagellar biosynthesis protein FlhB